jgi:hypothetical protein
LIDILLPQRSLLGEEGNFLPDAQHLVDYPCNLGVDLVVQDVLDQFLEGEGKLLYQLTQLQLSPRLPLELAHAFLEAVAGEGEGTPGEGAR